MTGKMMMDGLRCLVAGLMLSACGSPGTPATDLTAERDAPPPYVGKIWISTDSSAAPGTLRVFLPDSSLVMTSCVETYRLVRWNAIDERRIEWTEDTARIEAEIASVTADRLQLRLRLDPSRIDKSRVYGVRAVIKSGEKVLFQTDAPTPAITQGRPAEVKLLLTRAAGG